VFGVVGCPGFHSVLWTLPLSLFGLRFMQVGARLRCFCCTARWFLCSIYGARASLVSVRFSCLPTAQFFCPHSLVLAAAGFGPRCLGFRVNKFGGRIKIRSYRSHQFFENSKKFGRNKIETREEQENFKNIKTGRIGRIIGRWFGR
jgi:hypothetical protein